jgi:HPt (histidine-containing phosphotransfer) domain-containing protein
VPSSTEFEPQAVAALRALDRDGTLMPRLAAAFERTLARHQPALDAAQPGAALAAALHVLKTGAAQLGALALVEACERLEAGDVQALPELHRRLAAARAELATWA